jgi:endonuclease YncB( thermonuclease family)
MAYITPLRRPRAAPAWRPRRRASWLHRYFGFIALGAVMAFAMLTGLEHNDGAAVTRAERGTAPIQLEGHGSAVDGDTLRLGGERIRLVGIDAPESRQTCRDGNGQNWSCGRAATHRLSALLSGNVACTAQMRDRYGRPLARCAARGVADIGETLVREGLAVGYFGGYSQAEAHARAARRGLWSGTFDEPAAFRRQQAR